MEHLDIQTAIHVGYSMGVQVILELFREHGDRAKALVPMCGSYRHPLNTFRGSRRFKDDVFPHLYKLLTSDHERVLEFLRKTLPTELSYQIACFTEVNRHLIKREDFWPYLEHIATMDPNLFARMLKCADQHSAEDLLDQIGCPVMIFTGEKDRFSPSHLSTDMHQAIRNAQICVIPGGSHSAPLEVPDLINLRLEKFLQQNQLWP